MAKPVVFLSSTSDLVRERQALREALSSDYLPYLYELDAARKETAELWCRKRIEEACVFVGVLAENYGSRVGESDGPSIVEWEFNTARKVRHLQIMMFVKENLAPKAVDPEQKLFIDRISAFSSGVWRLEYSSPAQLVSKVTSSIQTVLAESYASLIARLRQLRYLNSILQPISGALVLTVCALAVSQARGDPVIGPIWLGALGATCIFIVALCFVSNRA